MVRLVATVFNAADDEPLDSSLWAGWLTLVVGGTLGLMAVNSVGVIFAWPEDSATLMFIGGLLLALAIYPPRWIAELLEAHLLAQFLGPDGLRILQVVIGIGALGIGVYKVVAT